MAEAPLPLAPLLLLLAPLEDPLRPAGGGGGGGGTGTSRYTRDVEASERVSFASVVPPPALEIIESALSLLYTELLRGGRSAPRPPPGGGGGLGKDVVEGGSCATTLSISARAVLGSRSA